MTPRRMALAAVLILALVFLSPIAFLLGQRTGLWLVTPSDDRGGPWYSPGQEERDLGGVGERPAGGAGAGHV